MRNMGEQEVDDDVDVEAYSKSLIAYQSPYTYTIKHPTSNLDGLS